MTANRHGGCYTAPQYLRVRDYNSTVWSPWAFIELVFPADYAAPPE